MQENALAVSGAVSKPTNARPRVNERVVVSIGMPVYNGENFIRPAIESIHRRGERCWTCFLPLNPSP